ncbi:hypothetical protein QBC37DRAFT_74411 [Rhypophila decipiens]|uniref:Zn(2)-C6 fungal-type domain-containing protein n=1 Tax=Rhypophila decipiens TaxID=261697 RepID=A0AAN6YK01_9PEZI|nr:hypothetical protein QBC37DRAFT_74411 [Rhypophila decipiens]
MMRRRHKKSRRGCLECKRRHIKCDETRPNCINCTTAERDCSYPAHSGSDGTSTAGHSPTASEGGPRNLSVSASPPMSSYATSSSNPTTAGLIYGGPGSGEIPQFTLGGLQEVNMGHMELFHHFITDSMMISACYPEISGEVIKTASVQHALREPFLMYQILSVSARHLCFLRPESSAFYQAQAMHLQSRALHLFNSLDVTAVGGYLQRSRGNLVSVYLFSLLVGIQSLSEMLSHRDHDFSAALARFLTYLRLHRGVNRLLDGHRHELAESEISPVLEMIGRPPPWLGGQRGHECDDLRRRILLVPDLRNEALDQILKAIDLLQFVIDGHLQLPQHPTCNLENRSHVLLSWPVLVGETFVELLESARPEALAVLGYYFVAMHYARDSVWMFCGSSGHYLLTLLSGYFGHGHNNKWADWIATPCQLLLEREDAQNLHVVGMEAAAGLFLSAPTSSPVAEHSISQHSTLSPVTHGLGHGHGHGHGHGLLGQQSGTSYWKP